MSNLEDRLAEAWDETIVPVVPLARVHERIRRARRRRMVALGAVAAMLTIAAVLVGTVRVTAPRPAEGRRDIRLGVGSMMVTVPEGWGVYEDGCAIPSRDYVALIDGGHYDACPGSLEGAADGPGRPLSMILLQATTSFRPDSGTPTTIDGLAVRRSPVTCPFPSDHCQQVVVAADGSASALFTVPSAKRDELGELERDTLSAIPKGQVAVPIIRRGSATVGVAMRRMTDAGLRPVPDLEVARGVVVVGARPAAGTIVARDTVVHLTERRLAPTRRTNDPTEPRRVGLGPLVLSVPPGWTTQTTRCGRPIQLQIVLSADPTPGCSPVPSSGKSAFVVRLVRLRLDRQAPLDVVPGDFGGIELAASPASCTQVACFASASDPGSGVEVMATSRAHPERLLLLLHRLVRPMPAGLTAVPPLDPHQPFSERADLLRAAGLHPVGVPQKGPLRHGTTAPPAGTVVRRGTTVLVSR